MALKLYPDSEKFIKDILANLRAGGVKHKDIHFFGLKPTKLKENLKKKTKLRERGRASPPH